MHDPVRRGAEHERLRRAAPASADRDPAAIRVVRHLQHGFDQGTGQDVLAMCDASLLEPADRAAQCRGGLLQEIGLELLYLDG